MDQRISGAARFLARERGEMTAGTAFLLSLVLAGCLPAASALRERLPIGYLPAWERRPSCRTPGPGADPMERGTIKAGAVVCLRSGGPPLTANRAEGDAWECLWFAGGELRSAVIAADALEPYIGRRGLKPVIPIPRAEGDDPS